MHKILIYREDRVSDPKLAKPRKIAIKNGENSGGAAQKKQKIAGDRNS